MSAPPNSKHRIRIAIVTVCLMAFLIVLSPSSPRPTTTATTSSIMSTNVVMILDDLQRLCGRAENKAVSGATRSRYLERAIGATAVLQKLTPSMTDQQAAEVKALVRRCNHLKRMMLAKI